MVFKPHLLATVNQKLLSFLAKFSDEEFYLRELSRRMGVSPGSCNRALNELFDSGVIRRRKEGKMLFYSINTANPALVEFKKLLNILLLEQLVLELKSVSHRIVLYGSCARGSDTSRSDMDLFIESNNRADVEAVIDSFHFPQGFEDIRIQAVIKNPVEMLNSSESEKVFLNEVDQGIMLWEKGADES